MVEQGAAHPPLGVPGEFSLADGKVGRPNRDTADGQGIGQPGKQQVVAAFDAFQPGAPLERQDQCDVQAAGTDDDRAASRLPVQQRNAARAAGGNAYPDVGFTTPGQYHGRLGGLPYQQPLAVVRRGG